ncbi:MAG TPA: CUAEP/CCAEP-tail radical SAM protein [Vicinamibacteria bacterium]|nr:CUAEP/CCAEP-tail radical SAM protein [Vicinamibacteria bacterium]
MTSGPGNVLLLSCYELGRRPLGLAVPLAFLKRSGFSARGIDLVVEPLDEAAVRGADFVGISVPMHTALRIALQLLPRIRALNPSCHICLYGLYATLNAELLLARGADSVLSGECEEALVERVVSSEPRERQPRPFRVRLDFPVPERAQLPALERYVHLDRGDGVHVLVEAIETTRGCLHLCRHCPIPPIYEGRFFVVPRETVLADIRQAVREGAHHVDFVDPDFLNGPGHALAIVRAMHREFPELTFDFTAKVEHLLRHRGILKELADSGCLFIVTAVESLSDRVLEELDKGHSQADVLEVLDATRRAGIGFRPTFVPFTPWTTLGDHRALLRWIAQERLVDDVEPVQLALRLLVPPGSLLLGRPALSPHLRSLDPGALTYRWDHPDPEMDSLQRASQKLVENAMVEGWSHRQTLAGLAELAGAKLPDLGAPKPTPRLTEAWFC